MMEIKTIKDIAKFIRTGKTPPTQEIKYFDGEINWYTPGDLDKGKFLSSAKRTLTQLAFEDKKAVVFPKNTLIVGCIGDIGKLGITVDNCSSNQQLTGIFPNEDVEVNYLYYWFRGNKSLIESYANNAVVPILNNRTLETIKIPLPPLPQQQKIANILDAADALRQNDKELIAKYDELIQALFLDTFGDPVSNPKGWEFSTIEKILFSKSQNGHYATKDEYSNNGVEMVHMSDAFYQKVIPGNLKKVMCDDKLLSKFVLKSSDLLISRRSLTYEGAAKPCFIPPYDKPLIYESSLIKLSPNLELISNVYLFYFLSNQRARSKYILIHVTKSTISGINNKGLNAIQVLLPPIKLQNQFAERVALIEEQKAIAQASLIKSEELFNSLLQKAFKGELA